MDNNEPVYKEIDIFKFRESKLFSNLCIPSTVQAYSLCVEYMRGWFLSKFDKTYFKSVHVDGKHVFDDFRRFNKPEMIKRQKPALAIVPQIDYSFDRDKLDLAMFGLDMYLKRSNYKNSFFKDEEKKNYIGLTLDMISMNFTFRVKVSSRAQGMDTLNYMKMAYRIGVTQGSDVDMDFHVPYKLMIDLANDSNFEVKDNKIVDVLGFLCHINKNSQIPFLYKLRNINGNNEFFIRVSDLYVHISTPDISMDDGEREGHLQTNFIIEMQSTVRFPSPKFYNYFSNIEHEEIRFTEDDGSTGSYILNLANVPSVNSKGWNQFMTTECIEEDLSKPLKVDFNELLGDLRVVIEYVKSIFLSPDLFIEIKLFNDRKEKKCKINWDTMILTVDEVVMEGLSRIVFYVDTNYLHTQLSNIEKYKKTRLS